MLSRVSRQMFPLAGHNSQACEHLCSSKVLSPVTDTGTTAFTAAIPQTSPSFPVSRRYGAGGSDREHHQGEVSAPPVGDDAVLLV